jgi:ABC-type polar amino acid transport system ATPase subunit
MERDSERLIQRLGARIASVRERTDPLSGVQRQSVAIARVLTFQPRLVIMDEPTAALGVREVEHVLELIRELKRQGIAVILIGHRLTDVFEVSNRINFPRVDPELNLERLEGPRAENLASTRRPESLDVVAATRKHRLLTGRNPQSNLSSIQTPLSQDTRSRERLRRPL